MKIRRLFALTTHAAHWFLEQGFRAADVAALPGERQALYNWKRGSKVFLKRIYNSLMARTVKCVKLGREAEGLDFPPYPGELGKRIWENVSKEAWAQWLKQQTMLVNENRLNLADPRRASTSWSRSSGTSSAKAPTWPRGTSRREVGLL